MLNSMEKTLGVAWLCCVIAYGLHYGYDRYKTWRLRKRIERYYR